jgi:NMD protein affecting ribosome stability and mRNA decay
LPCEVKKIVNPLQFVCGKCRQPTVGRLVAVKCPACFTVRTITRSHRKQLATDYCRSCSGRRLGRRLGLSGQGNNARWNLFRSDK